MEFQAVLRVNINVQLEKCFGEGQAYAIFSKYNWTVLMSIGKRGLWFISLSFITARKNGEISSIFCTSVFLGGKKKQRKKSEINTRDSFILILITIIVGFENHCFLLLNRIK